MRSHCLLRSSFLFVGLGCTAPSPEVEEARHLVGTELFAPYTAQSVGSWPSATAIADVNGDGLNEVLMTTDSYSDPPNDFKLMVFRPDGVGGMHEIARYPIDRGAKSLSIGDVNGDGRKDVVLAHSSSSTIGILYQNAAGTLDPMVTIATSCSELVRVADLNSDGRQDIVAIGWGGDAVELYLQDELGQLVGPTTYREAHGGYDDLEVGDLNHDGRTDIVVMSGQSSLPNIGVLLQTVEGTFAEPVYYSAGSQVFARAIAIGDVNGDGWQDIVLVYWGSGISNSLGAFTQNESGGLNPFQSYTTTGSFSSVTAADVDGNGFHDVLALQSGWEKLSVFSQTTPGSLDPQVDYVVPYASLYLPDGLAVGDFTDDGLPDVAIADYLHGLVTLVHLPGPSDTTPPVVTVEAPTGGEVFMGSPLVISWAASDNVALAGFEVLYSADGGATTSALAECSGLGADARSCTWANPGPASPTAVIRVVARDSSGNTAAADRAFVLRQPSLAVTRPDRWFIGTPQSIFWSGSLPVGDAVMIELSRDGANTWEVVAASAPNTGSYAITVTGPEAADARLKVSWLGHPEVQATTAPGFSIEQGMIGVTTPNTRVTVRIGQTSLVNWTHNLGANATFNVELSRDGGSTWARLGSNIGAASSTTGSYAWLVTSPKTNYARARVTWTTLPGVTDMSDVNFIIK